MRNQIFEALSHEMRVQEDIFFITADMGINLVEPIAQEFPDRFLNVGIAEQNAIGVAAGLASAGYFPWIYSISNFLIHRCFEQIRNDLVLHGFRAVLLGTSAGYDNATLGPTHHVIDDWGLIGGLPGTSVFTPATEEFASDLVKRVSREPTLSYVRIAKQGISAPDSNQEVVARGSGKSGRLIVTYGGLGGRVWTSPNSQGDDRVLLLNKVWPLPKALVEAIRARPQHVIIIEDHFPHTGLSSRVATIIAEEGIRCRFTSKSPKGFDFEVQSSATAWELAKNLVLDNET